MIVFKILFLASLIKILIQTDKPFVCSGTYTAALFIFGYLFNVMAGQTPFVEHLLTTGLAFALSSIYFWLLYRIGDGLLWWGVMVLGLAIGLV